MSPRKQSPILEGRDCCGSLAHPADLGSRSPAPLRAAVDLVSTCGVVSGALAFWRDLPGDMSREVSVALPVLSTTSDCEKCVIHDPDRTRSAWSACYGPQYRAGEVGPTSSPSPMVAALPLPALQISPPALLGVDQRVEPGQAQRHAHREEQRGDPAHGLPAQLVDGDGAGVQVG